MDSLVSIWQYNIFLKAVLGDMISVLLITLLYFFCLGSNPDNAGCDQYGGGTQQCNLRRLFELLYRSTP